MTDIDKNWIEYCELLKKTGREGIDNLIKYLESVDMKDDPASAKYHSNYAGGLVKHSLNVYKYAIHNNKVLKLDLPENEIIIASLLHDICKTKYYIKGTAWDKEWKDQSNQWRKMKIWKVEEEWPLGHGEKSVIIASRYVELTIEEMSAIRWHMGAWDVSLHFFYPNGSPFKSATERYPIVKLLMIADQAAELYESIHEKKEEVY